LATRFRVTPEMWLEAIEALLAMTPKGMRAAVVIQQEDQFDIQGSCCDPCTATVIHHAADLMADPRGADEKGAIAQLRRQGLH
jgi:hypothetical protein